jgi:cytochrome c
MVRILKLFGAAAAATALLATNASAAGDPAKGKDLFARCMVCHTADKGGPNRVGPNLFGVVGRKAGTLSGFSFSPAMKNSGITWDEEVLAKYLLSPSKMVPGTKMPFGGFNDPNQAADVAAYLATLK